MSEYGVPWVFVTASIAIGTDALLALFVSYGDMPWTWWQAFVCIALFGSRWSAHNAHRRTKLEAAR